MNIFCSACGAKIEETARFCPSCGEKNMLFRGVGFESKPVEKLVNACPICHKNDMVAKVSVIYQDGTHNTSSEVPVTVIDQDSDNHINSSIRFITMQGTSSSQLATLLSPPIKSEPPYHGFGLRGGFLNWWNIEVIGYILFLYGFAAVSTWLTVDGNPNFFAILFLIFISFILFLWLVIFRRFVNGKKKIKIAKDMAIYQPLLMDWERKIEEWNKLYYCKRDGKTFIPDNKE